MKIHTVTHRLICQWWVVSYLIVNFFRMIFFNKPATTLGSQKERPESSPIFWVSQHNSTLSLSLSVLPTSTTFHERGNRVQSRTLRPCSWFFTCRRLFLVFFCVQNSHKNLPHFSSLSLHMSMRVYDICWANKGNLCLYVGYTTNMRQSKYYDDDKKVTKRDRQKERERGCVCGNDP